MSISREREREKEGGEVERKRKRDVQCINSILFIFNLSLPLINMFSCP